MSTPVQPQPVRISTTFPTLGSYTCVTVFATLAGPQSEAQKLTNQVQEWVQDNVRRNGPYWTLRQEKDFIDFLKTAGILLHNPEGPAYIATESDRHIIAMQYWLNGVRQNHTTPRP